MSKKSLLADIEPALAELDEEDLSALQEMLDESPELLRQTLIEYGYRTEESSESSEMLTNSSAGQLSQAQQDLCDELEGELDPPQTLSEILDTVGSDDAAFRQRYSSAQYRSWLNEQLNALVEAGEIGRYRDGRDVTYAESPELAVRHWTRLNERFVEGLSVTDAAAISNDTKMPVPVVREAITALSNE